MIDYGIFENLQAKIDEETVVRDVRILRTCLIACQANRH